MAADKLPPITPDRRPIAARSHRIWITAARHLSSSGVSANIISLAGMVFGLSAGAALLFTAQTNHPWDRALWASAAALIALRLLCNMLDGMVAINSGRASPVGELYNEVPDRISDAATLAGLGYAAGSSPELGWAAAAMAIFVAYVRAAAKVAGAPQDYRGPMAKQQRMLTVIAISLFLACAPAAWRPELSTHGWTLPRAALWLIIAGSAITILRRLLRASSILRRGDA